MASAAVDWLTHSFKHVRGCDLDDQWAFSRWLADQVSPEEPWPPPRPSRHFAASSAHPSGVRFSFSPLESGAGVSEPIRNEGLSCLDLTGRFFASTPPHFHQEVFAALKAMPGAYRCNRLDVQITVLDPEPDAQGVAELVRDRKIWPKGYGRHQTYCEHLQSGDFAGPVTQYWGSRTSRVRARIYDKAAEQGWDVPAVRAEVQMRREPADQWFRRLARLSQDERDVPPLLVTAEARTVRSAVGQELDIKDTSAWADRELPQRWAQYAPTPGWWREWINQAVDPLAVQYHRPTDLAATTTAAVEQYGRKVALELVRQALANGGDMEQVLQRLFFRGVQRWRHDDLATLLALVPEEQHDDARTLYWSFVNAAARITEQEP